METRFPTEWAITQSIFWLTHKLVMQMRPKLWLKLFFHILRTGALSESVFQFREMNVADKNKKEIRFWVVDNGNGKKAFDLSIIFLL